MQVEVGQIYKRRAKLYEIKKVDDTGQFVYIWALEEGVTELPDNEACRVFGSKVFASEFKFMKGGN